VPFGGSVGCFYGTRAENRIQDEILTSWERLFICLRTLYGSGEGEKRDLLLKLPHLENVKNALRKDPDAQIQSLVECFALICTLSQMNTFTSAYRACS